MLDLFVALYVGVPCGPFDMWWD